MIDSNVSQSHNPFVALVEGQLARAEAFFAQLGEVEAKTMEQAKTALDEQARLTRETMTYAAAMSAEWRRASFDIARRAAKAMSPVG